jgi:hypothetical protein
MLRERVKVRRDRRRRVPASFLLPNVLVLFKLPRYVECSSSLSLMMGSTMQASDDAGFR